MKKRTLVLLASLLVVVVAFSGCTELPGFGGGEASGGIATGVIIKSFGPDISEIFSEDEVTFSLTVENVGAEDATDVEAKLFGLGTDWKGRKEGEEGWFSWEQADKIESIGSLENSQPEYELSGGTGDAQWVVKSPVNLKVDNTYSASVALYYTYSTTALANIKIYNNDYLTSNPEDAESILRASGIETFSVTNAPIKIGVTGLARPLIYKSEGQKASITIKLGNIGQGKPYKTEESDMTVTVNKIEINSGECEGTVEKDYRLPRAGEKSIPCIFTLPAIDSYTTIPVEIEITYNYFLYGTTSIKVLKSLYISDNGETPTPSPPSDDGDYIDIVLPES